MPESSSDILCKTDSAILCERILELDESIRFAGICLNDAKLISHKYRQEVNPLLSKNETETSAYNAYKRLLTRRELEHKTGKFQYTVTTYEKIKRATLALSEKDILLVSFEKEKDEYLILNKIILLLKNREWKLNADTYELITQGIENRIAREKLALVGKLSNRVAHDIRNPLAIIRNSVDLIKLKSNDAAIKSKRDYDRIDRAINRIVHQIDSVLNYVSISEINITTNSIRQVLTSAINETIVLPENIEIKIFDTDEIIDCDEKKLKVVFHNLLLNSIQEIGNKKGIIKIRLRSNNQYVQIEFEDSGNGIKKEDIHQIFEPLFTTKQQGTGMGLVSCKTIVELHGGHIHVKNNPTVLTIQLPR